MGSYWSTEDFFDDEEIVDIKENVFLDDYDDLTPDELSVHRDIFWQCYQNTLEKCKK